MWLYTMALIYTMAYQRGSRVAELLAHLLAPGESWGERWGYKSGVKGRVWVGVGVSLDPMRLTSPRRSAPARRSSPRCAGRTWMATGRWNRQLGRRLARAPEAVAGRSVGRPLPGSAELPIASVHALGRHRSRAGALPGGWGGWGGRGALSVLRCRWVDCSAARALAASCLG